MNTTRTKRTVERSATRRVVRAAQWSVGVFVAILVALTATSSGAHAATWSPLATWTGSAHCTSGWCTGQNFANVFTITSWNPSTGAITASGENGTSTGTGTYKSGVLRLHLVQPGYYADSVLTISANGGAFAGTWTDSHGVGGTQTFQRKGGPPPTTAELSPEGKWTGKATCTKGTCAGAFVATEITITKWNPATGAFVVTSKNGTGSGTFKNLLLTINGGPLQSAPFSKATMSTDGGTLSGTWVDNVNNQGTVVLKRVGGAQITPTTTIAGSATSSASTTATASTAVSSSTTDTATTTTTVTGVATTVAGGAGGAKSGPTSTLFPAPGAKRSSFLNIPNPGDALTLRNIAEAAGLSLILMLLIAFPSTLFNDTLDANLDIIRGWFPAFLRVRQAPEPTEPVDGEAVEGEPAPVSPKRSYWHTWPGFVTFMVIADVLYSLMQPGWGFNRGTLHSLMGFLVGTAFSTFTGITITRRYLRRYGQVSGHMKVEVATLTFAVVCVVASRLANFVPGYFYGVIAGYETSYKPSTDDSGKMRVRSMTVTYTLAIVGWLLFVPLRKLAHHGGFVQTMPLSMAGGFVTGALDFAVIGLLPMRFLPGAALKKWNTRIWTIAYAFGAFLFTLVLLHPGLVSAPNDHSVAWTIGLASFFAVGSIAFWWYFKDRAKREEARLVPVSAIAESPATE